MTEAPAIALDTMGGDHAPGIVLRGAEYARQRHPDIRYHLVGDEPRIKSLLDRHRNLRECSEILHAEQVVETDERPSLAVRRKNESSMAVAVDCVRDNVSDAVVSAGNTGALMAFSMVRISKLAGIHRPAIAAVLPTRRSESVILDLGANTECEPIHLVQFAVMGMAFARVVLGRENPVVQLLNVGAEEGKGPAGIRSAAEMLRSEDVPLSFGGYVEGDRIWRGEADVVVSDGFAGNVLLKTAEGAADVYTHYLRSALQASPSGWLAGLLGRSAFRSVREKLDPRKLNGAVFLGLNGIVIKSHGGTDALGFAHSIDVAHDMVAGSVNDRILEVIQESGVLPEQTALQP